MKTTRLYGVFILLLALPVFGIAQPAPDAYNNYLAASNQVVFVTAANWNARQGKLQLYSRKNNHSKWVAGLSFPVTFGRNGLAFDKQSKLDKPDTAVVKQEGDGRSPAGIFGLGPVFSYHNVNDVRMPFKKVDTTDICVDDAGSAHYNTMVNDTATAKDWNSFEYMRRNDELYEYGVWVKYNTDSIFAGSGSCIFLHIWEGSTSTTSGCTAMQKENMLALIHWLNSSNNPVLVQVVAKAQ